MRNMSTMSFTLVALVCRAKYIIPKMVWRALANTITKFFLCCFISHLFLLTFIVFHPFCVITKRFSVILCHWNHTEERERLAFQQLLYTKNAFCKDAYIAFEIKKKIRGEIEMVECMCVALSNARLLCWLKRTPHKFDGKLLLILPHRTLIAWCELSVLLSSLL